MEKKSTKISKYTTVIIHPAGLKPDPYLQPKPNQRKFYLSTTSQQSSKKSENHCPCRNMLHQTKGQKRPGRCNQVR